MNTKKNRSKKGMSFCAIDKQTQQSYPFTDCQEEHEEYIINCKIKMKVFRKHTYILNISERSI